VTRIFHNIANKYNTIYETAFQLITLHPHVVRSY